MKQESACLPVQDLSAIKGAAACCHWHTLSLFPSYVPGGCGWAFKFCKNELSRATCPLNISRGWVWQDFNTAIASYLYIFPLRDGQSQSCFINFQTVWSELRSEWSRPYILIAKENSLFGTIFSIFVSSIQAILPKSKTGLSLVSVCTQY